MTTKADQPDPAERIAAALERLSRDATLIMNSLEELVRLARRAAFQHSGIRSLEFT